MVSRASTGSRTGSRFEMPSVAEESDEDESESMHFRTPKESEEKKDSSSGPSIAKPAPELDKTSWGGMEFKSDVEASVSHGIANRVIQGFDGNEG